MIVYCSVLYGATESVGACYGAIEIIVRPIIIIIIIIIMNRC